MKKILILILFILTGCNNKIYNQNSLVSGDKYAIAVEYADGEFGYQIMFYVDTSSPTHNGNYFYSNDSTNWSSDSGTDAGFYVYGELIDTCTYSGTGDWYIKAKDNCYIKTDTYVEGTIFLLADEGPGALHIIDNSVLSVHRIDSTSTPIYIEAGSKITK